MTIATHLNELGKTLEETLKLPSGRGASLLMRTFALTRGLWQSSQPCQEAEALKSEAALASLYPDFIRELMEALAEYWHGALTLKPY
jgi:hypothetical protein